MPFVAFETFDQKNEKAKIVRQIEGQLKRSALNDKGFKRRIFAISFNIKFRFSSSIFFRSSITQQTKGCPKKVTFRILLEPQCNCSITRSRHPSQPYLDEPASGSFFCRFLVRQSRIKRSQVVYMGGFSPVALNFG